MKMMKLGLAVLFLFNIFGCSGLVSYTGLYSYAEVSLEKKDYLVVRALPLNSSYTVTHYKFYKFSDNKYFLTFYFEFGDKHPVPEIEYKKWRGIEVTIPRGSFNPEKDVIYYKDDKGEYKLTFGTYETWQDYLKREWKEVLRETK